ncbi:hypothetical protein [Cynomolgus macaque cytomegalovirus strain Mauritius]|uniref:Uncharacterized protein n=1 Tax=Cynomolgus macaque cytomegalovirus strain Mauritius TaxID=1690255 RepID=A0A0K1H0V9_9BETA|nr:hypothetical protein [Cynomolgus macaque cytomegalovirus strain Mauritius]AXG21728.1 hypothetical protein [synthetic construct]AXG21996.1 hypothetical protein [synthetic construct]
MNTSYAGISSPLPSSVLSSPDGRSSPSSVMGILDTPESSPWVTSGFPTSVPVIPSLSCVVYL